MNNVKLALDVLEAGSALAAAVLWFRSAMVKIPGMTWQPPEENPMYTALREAAKRNARAAGCAGISALSQTVALALYGP